MAMGAMLSAQLQVIVATLLYGAIPHLQINSIDEWIVAERT